MFFRRERFGAWVRWGFVLPCFCLMGGSFVHAGALDRLRVFLESTRTLQAEFVQTVVVTSGRRAQVSSGVMMLSRPGKFRWQIDQPEPQLIVGDGEKIWLYDVDLKQVTIRKMGVALGGTPAVLLTGEANLASLEKQFTLRDAGEQEGLEWVEAKSRSPDSGFERLRLGFSGLELRLMELFDYFGQTTTVRFNKIERNRTLSPGLFRFTIPAGVDVLTE